MVLEGIMVLESIKNTTVHEDLMCGMYSFARSERDQFLLVHRVRKFLVKFGGSVSERA